MLASLRTHSLAVLCFLLVHFAGNVKMSGQGPNNNALLEQAVTASRQSSTLSADILLTWRSGGVTRQTSGTIQLTKPNLGRIVLKGEYPQVLLISDGRTKYFAPSEEQFQKSPIDAKGFGIDSPWWGLPFRFFFTQSVNPFGTTADPSATYSNLNAEAAGDHLSGIMAKGSSPMGAYTEKLFFDSSGDLVESSVQFGEGPGAALFQARLNNIRHDKVTAATFRFTAKAGQVAVGNTDTMLPLGTQAPSFNLLTPESKRVSLDQQLRGSKAVLVNFWYYNCAPCRIEFPEFEKLYKQFASEGFTIVAIDKGDSSAVVSKYKAAAGLSFPIVIGGDVSKDSVFARFKVTEAFPGSYLLDEHGKIVYRSTGEDIAGLKQALAQLGFK